MPATPALPVPQSLLGSVWPVPINATTDMIYLNCTLNGNACLCTDHTNRNHPVCFTVNSPILLFGCCRDFRCDCGNGKFKGFKCQLNPVSPLTLLYLTLICIAQFVCYLCSDCSRYLLFSQSKDEENVRNRYNHNFSGCYCVCDRPYPDDQVGFYFISCFSD